MTQLNFDLKAALQGAEVRTRDGRKVTDVQVKIAEAPFSAQNVDEYAGEEYIKGITAVIHNEHFKDTYEFYHSGGSHIYGLETEADLTTDF